MNGLRTLSILATLFLFVACRNELAEIALVVGPDDVEKEVINDFQMLYSDSANVRVRLRGPSLVRYIDDKDPRIEFPDGVNVEFFSPSKRVTSRLTARYGIRHESDGKVILRDSVVWESVDRETLESEELIWDEEEGRVYTNKFVTIRRPDEIVWGYGFESDQDFTRSRIRAIEGKIKVDKLNHPK